MVGSSNQYLCERDRVGLELKINLEPYLLSCFAHFFLVGGGLKMKNCKVFFCHFATMEGLTGDQ